MFPKGKVNKDETEVRCAIREVEEETGYNCANLLMVNQDSFLERVCNGHTYVSQSAGCMSNGGVGCRMPYY